MAMQQNSRQESGSGFQTGNVVLISLAHLSHDVFSSFLAPLLPLLIAKLGLSLSAVGLLDIARKVPQLGNPLIGLLADKICVKWFVILAPAVTATAMSLLGLAPSFPVLFILLLISGFSAAAFHVPGPVLIKHHAGNRSGRGMSFYMFGGEMARTLGTVADHRGDFLVGTGRVVAGAAGGPAHLGHAVLAAARTVPRGADLGHSG